MADGSWRCLVGRGLQSWVASGSERWRVAGWDEVSSDHDRRDLWLILEARANEAADWLALDFDNPDGSSVVGVRALALAARVLAEAAREGHRAFWWPSKSRSKHPQGGAGHAFFWLPGRDPDAQRDRVRAWLTAALGAPPTELVPEAREAVGLNPALQVFFPPDLTDEAEARVRLSVAATAHVGTFHRVWQWFCGLP